jgi:hypothetical protein
MSRLKDLKDLKRFPKRHSCARECLFQKVLQVLQPLQDTAQGEDEARRAQPIATGRSITLTRCEHSSIVALEIADAELLGFSSAAFWVVPNGLSALSDSALLRLRTAAWSAEGFATRSRTAREVRA